MGLIERGAYKLSSHEKEGAYLRGGLTEDLRHNATLS